MSGEGCGVETEHTLEPSGPSFCAAHKVTVGVKRIRFSDKHGKTSISFTRGVSHDKKDDVRICVEEQVSIKAKCSMGHEHETGKKETQWGYISLSWPHFEKLLEWFEQGTWREIRDLRGQK